MMHANAALTGWTKETDKITSSEINFPYNYLYKVSGWLSPRVKVWFSGNVDTSPAIEAMQEQVIDVTSTTIGISLNQSGVLEQLYTFRDPAIVHLFLHQHPHLISLLLEAISHIRKYFPDQQTFLEVISNPEAVSSQLVAIIVETSSPDEAFERLERFDNEWWISAVGRAKGKLCVNVEFV